MWRTDSVVEWYWRVLMVLCVIFGGLGIYVAVKDEDRFPCQPGYVLMQVNGDEYCVDLSQAIEERDNG